ncbi:hypothetical protein F511_22920 [Dorcoceras hygrometricum]|uniref:Uncharacterized protein n=1 Tax=Dorcoceras hygrometricum TaxID=472368 RepID=A0A2Z7C2I8_9LAMI|nr:hypothetical protein F511_22920 [Dorcoceras hygrometricum]
MHNQSAGGNHRSVIFRSVDHHILVVFRHDDSAGHHLDDSIGPFQARQFRRPITMLARLGSSIKHQAQYISPGHDTNGMFKSASLLAYDKAQQKQPGSSNLSKDLTKPVQLNAYVDWAVKGRIRPPDLETSICDVKYHVSLALSVIPRGSWGDVSRRFTMIRWASPKIGIRIRRCANKELRPATTTLLKTDQLKSERKTLKKAYPRAQTDRENYRPEIREDARTCNNFALPQQADPKLQTGTNLKLRDANPAPPDLLHMAT